MYFFCGVLFFAYVCGILITCGNIGRKQSAIDKSLHKNMFYWCLAINHISSIIYVTVYLAISHAIFDFTKDIVS